MSFASRLKRALGFGPDDDEFEDSDFSENSESMESSESAEHSENSENSEHSEISEAPQIDPAMKARIFEGVVEIFNRSLPDFVGRSVDPERQRLVLLESLDKGLNDYLNSLMEKAEQYAESKLKGATESARRESERLRADMQQIEQQRSSLREQQLSADRRRRALADRVTDLEAQLANAEAEREQFELEKRSLLNKLKVADIQPGVVDELQREIDMLRSKLANSGPDSSAAPDPAIEEELAKAREDLKELEQARARIAELEAVAARVAEVEGLNADLRKQHELTQGMYDDLQKSFATERDGRLAAEKSLAEARKVEEQVNEIQEQMSQVESVIQKRDERIARLKTANKKLRDQIDDYEKRIAAANDCGLFATAETPVTVEKKTSSLSTDSLAAIEDEFEVPDWFVSEPQPGEVSPLLTSDAEFGYQEPPRKPRKPENDAQLSLF